MKLEAPGALEDHCTLGAAQCAGVEAVALKLAAVGSVTVWALGCSSIAGLIVQGAALTVSLTASARRFPGGVREGGLEFGARFRARSWAAWCRCQIRRRGSG